MKSLLLFIITFLIFSCGLSDEPEKESIDASRIILDAKAFTFSDLPDEIKTKARGSHVYNYSDNTSFIIKKNDGYYLRMTVDNVLLAKASANGTGVKESGLLDSSNFRQLYGKYRNNPSLYNSKGELITRTMKHEGYNLIEVIRNGNTDTTYWGPVNDIPARLVLTCSNLDSANTPAKNVMQ